MCFPKMKKSKRVCPSCRYSGKLVQVDFDGKIIEGSEAILICRIETEIMLGKAECPYELEMIFCKEEEND